MDGSLAVSAPGAGRIGPNAVTRLAEAVGAAHGEASVLALFRDGGLLHHVDSPPGRMVPEADVTRLHAALRARFGLEEAGRIAAEAGRRTAAYLLAHRIPRPAQWLMRALPARLSARLLLRAIGRHSWTFAGSGRFRAEGGHPACVTIEGCPLCRGAAPSAAPVCGYYAATLEALFRVLVARGATARETRCAALGDPACVFVLDW